MPGFHESWGAAPELPDISSSPIAVYIAVAVVAVGALSQISETVRKMLGPLGAAIQRRQDRKLAKTEGVIDARIADQDEQIAFLRKELSALRAEVEASREEVDASRRARFADRKAAMEYMRWAGLLVDAARAAGVQVTDPPPIMATDTW